MSVSAVDHNHIHAGQQAAVSRPGIVFDNRFDFFRFHLGWGTTIMVIQLYGCLGPVSLDGLRKPVERVDGLLRPDVNGMTGMKGGRGVGGAVPQGHDSGPSPGVLPSPLDKLPGYVAIAGPQVRPDRGELDPVLERHPPAFQRLKNMYIPAHKKPRN